MTATFVLTARGPFSLATSTGFLEGFAPAAYTGMAGQPLEAAFPVAGTWQTAGVRVREHPGGVECEIVSPAAPGRELLAALRAQVARILSLDVDGSGFPALAERDPVIAGLRARYPGLRPVAFWSPDEAAAWAVIGQRIRIRQAAAIKAASSSASAATGGRTAPGPRCCCVSSWKSRPTRSPTSPHEMTRNRA